MYKYEGLDEHLPLFYCTFKSHRPIIKIEQTHYIITLKFIIQVYKSTNAAPPQYVSQCF